MLSFHLNCPHCEKDETFSVERFDGYTAQNPVERGEPFLPSEPVIREIPSHNDEKVKVYGVACCPKCARPVLVFFEVSHRFLRAVNSQWELGSFWQISMHMRNDARILNTYPEQKPFHESIYFPEKIRLPYRELQQDVRDGRRPASIIVNCRSILEVALSSLGFEQKPLMKKIEAALEKKIITEDMCKWSHEIRINGNEAVHELTASQKEAHEFVDFLRILLEILYELPERIKLLKKQDPHQ